MAFDDGLYWLGRVSCVVVFGVSIGCAAGGVRQYPLKAPLRVDGDRRPFKGEPEEYFSPFGWDAANQTIFRPIAQFFAVDPGERAKNVNALDEVPDSSWFTNRIGQYEMTPEQVARGPCVTPQLDVRGPWTVTGAKPNGANPGFLIKASDDRRYLLKFDGVIEGPRPTAADVVGSRIYHAAGYFVPCNRIVYFHDRILRIDPDAEAEDEQGNDVPLARHHIDTVLSKALRLPDGRYRANASLFIEGKPIGPWTYEDTRDDDPNDVIPHEDRRELRGARVLAAWTNHFDSREQNTLAAFMKQDSDMGYVRHYVIDFGDCFGSIWEPPMLGRRIGYAYYLDFNYVAEDFLTLGLVRRPWDRARFGPTGAVFSYYDVELFEPHAWRPGYPNPAFGRMDEGDAAWAARIVARFTDEHIDAIVAMARFDNPAHAARLSGVLKGRRDKVLRRYLTRRSPLTDPTVRIAKTGSFLCLSDLGVISGVASASSRAYAARLVWPPDLDGLETLPVHGQSAHQVCVPLPPSSARASSQPRYGIVDVWVSSGAEAIPPARVHLYDTGSGGYRVVALERPGSHRPPGN